MSRPIAHLVVRSPWSFLQGASSLEALAAAAAERGVTALGIVDRDAPWAALAAWRACRRHGVRALIGAELQGDDGRAWVLARDAGGYRALCTASSALATGGARRVAPLLRERSAGLWVLADRGPLLASLARGVPVRRLRAAVTPSGPRRAIVAEARRLGVAVVAVGDVHFTSAAEREVQRLLRAIARGCHPARVPEHDLAPPEAWLQDEGAMRRGFADLPGAVDEATRLAEGCTLDLARDLPLGHPRLPSLAPLGIDDPDAALAAAARAGLARRGPDRRRHRETLARELRDVAQRGTAACFLVAADLVAHARQAGIACCGRGPVAGSVLAYALQLADVDPLAHGLWSERALGRGPAGMPDWDLDVDARRRDELQAHVAERHGRDRVAAIGTHVVHGARGAVRAVGKLLGLSEADLAAVARGVHEPIPATVPAALAGHPRLRHLHLERPPWSQVWTAARTLAAFPRHASVHPGGLVIGPGPLAGQLPLFRSAGGDVATAWDAADVEALGLFHVDLLGNRALGVVADAERLVRAGEPGGGGVDPAVADPLSDGPTRAALRRADTVGCTQLEAPGTRWVLRRMGCESLEDLMIATAIVRPGVAGAGMMRTYLERRSSARRGVPSRAPRPLDEILGARHGVIVFQDDVLAVARQLGGLDGPDAEALLEAVAGRDREGRLAALRRRLLDGARARGLDDEQVRTLWGQIAAFAGFGMSRTHAASHALVSARMVALRVHHPAALMAAVIGAPGGGYAPAAYVSEARRMGLTVSPPCVNRSAISATGAGNALRLGLAAVRGLQPGTARRLVAEREAGGAYRSLEDLVERLELEPGELDDLIRAGALDGCAAGRSRAGLLWLRVALAARGRGRRDGPALPLRWSTPAPGADAPVEGRLERMMLEHQALGVIVSGHPLELFGPFLPLDRDRAAELPGRAGERVELAGWKVSLRTIRTRDGGWIEQGAFEDETALFDVVLLPDVLRRHQNELTRGGPFLVRGVVREEDGVPAVVVRQLRLLADPGQVDGAA